MNQKENNYLSDLDTLRFFAAIAVVVFHFGLWSWPINTYFLPYFKVANLGVSFFFVLSGFIMFYVYRNMTMNSADIHNFTISRLTRILPLYFVSLLITILYLLKFESFTFSIKTLLCHIFFLQAWVPGEVLTLNFVNWTLSIELLFYLLFPVLFLCIKKSPRSFFIFTLLFWLISNVVTIYLSLHLDVSSISNYEFAKFFPLLHLNNFLIGMTAGYFYLHKSISKSAVKYFAYAAGLFFLVYPLVVPSFMYVGHHNGLFAPLFALVILYVLNSENYINTFLRLKIFTLCGKASYGVYLLQVPVYWFTYLTYKELGVFDFLGEEFRFYIFLIVLIATSVLSYYLFEKKVMLILRKKLLK